MYTLVDIKQNKNIHRKLLLVQGEIRIKNSQKFFQYLLQLKTFYTKYVVNTNTLQIEKQKTIPLIVTN